MLRFFTSLLFILLVSTIKPAVGQPLAEGQLKFLGNGIDAIFHPNYLDYWNQVTPGNAGKWGSVEYNQDQYNWTQLDNIYNYAQQNNLLYKHHTLIWGNQQPGWIGALDSAEQRAEVEEWIQLVGGRYPDMDMVDVVNEPLHAVPDYAQGLGGDGESGWDWIITSFELARQYCPANTELILNEYNVLHSSVETGRYLEIISLLQERGLIDAIGIQGHYFEFKGDGYTYSINAIESNLNRLAETGLPVYITEFDIDEEDDQDQLESYQTYFPIFWEHPAVKGMTLWGYVEGDMWQADGYLIHDSFGRYEERPAMEWLREYISNPPPPENHYVGDWGILANQYAGWDFVPGAFVGNAAVTGQNSLDSNWCVIRGQFDKPYKISDEYAINIEGKIEFIGNGSYAGNKLHFGIFFHDSVGILQNAYTDSAHWTGNENHAAGYVFVPPNGANQLVAWADGSNGNVGVVRDGNVNLTNGDNKALIDLDQYPSSAELTEGTYEWAISVQQIADNTIEIRFYMIKEDESYWFGSIDTTITDTTLKTMFLNDVTFALNGSDEEDTSALRGMDILDVYIKTGDPIVIPCCPTNISNQDTQQPYRVELHQNYPNPFNPVTSITYLIPERSNVRLEVFNISGQHVKTLVAREQPAGQYLVFFNAGGLSSGIYFYRLTTANYSSVKQMLLLR